MKAMQIQSTKQLQDQAREAEKARSKLASEIEAEQAKRQKMNQEYQTQMKHLNDESAKSLM
jgi:hypothetical protein